MTREERLLAMLKEADILFIHVSNGEESSDAEIDALARNIVSWRERLAEELLRS